MDNQKKMIKDDINFLEYPNWVVDQKTNIMKLVIKKDHGTYEITSPHGLPKHLDKIILYFLLHKLYQEKKLNTHSLITSRYEIAKSIYSMDKDFGKNKFERIMLALKKWHAVSINFNGIFYGDDGNTVRYFSVIDEVTLYKESGKLIIKFNESYITQLKETKFYKLIDFEQFKKLHRTSSARLYEILIKTFKGRNEWAINIQLLAEKMTFEKRSGAKNYYPSDVLRHLNPAINEINKKTDLFVNFNFNKETEICVFKKINRQKTIKPATKTQVDTKQKEPSLAEQIDSCMKQFNAIPLDEQKAILSDIRKQPLFKFLPNDETRIFTYMTNRNKQSIESE